MHPGFKVVLTICLVTLTAVMSMLSPFFQITEIIVRGNEQVTEDEILSRAGLYRPTNIFLFGENQVRRGIIGNLYIESVDFQRNLPGTLTITVQERFVTGYVEYMEGRFLHIDENGRVLSVSASRSGDFPIITGLSFSNVRLGEILDVENPEAFRNMVIYAQLLHANGLSDVVTQLDVSDVQNTRMRLYSVDVHLGDTRHAADKIAALNSIINTWPMIKESRGILYMRERAQDYIFRHLT